MHAPSSIRRRVLAGATLLCLAVSPLAAQRAPLPLMDEGFSYPDGSLSDRPDSPWRGHLGAGVAQISGGALYLGSGNAQAGFLSRAFDVSAEFMPSDVTAVRYELELKVEWQPHAVQRYNGVIAQLTNHNADLRRARLLFRTEGAGLFRLGIASRRKENPAWFPRDLAFGAVHRVVVTYDLAEGTTRLVVLAAGDAANDAAPVVSKETETVMKPRRFAVQVDETQRDLVLRVDSVRVQALR